jgi:hypothetical protein
MIINESRSRSCTGLCCLRILSLWGSAVGWHRESLPRTARGGREKGDQAEGPESSTLKRHITVADARKALRDLVSRDDFLNRPGDHLPVLRELLKEEHERNPDLKLTVPLEENGFCVMGPWVCNLSKLTFDTEAQGGSCFLAIGGVFQRNDEGEWRAIITTLNHGGRS